MNYITRCQVYMQCGVLISRVDNESFCIIFVIYSSILYLLISNIQCKRLLISVLTHMIYGEEYEWETLSLPSVGNPMPKPMLKQVEI